MVGLRRFQRGHPKNDEHKSSQSRRGFARIACYAAAVTLPTITTPPHPRNVSKPATPRVPTIGSSTTGSALFLLNTSWPHVVASSLVHLLFHSVAFLTLALTHDVRFGTFQAMAQLPNRHDTPPFKSLELFAPFPKAYPCLMVLRLDPDWLLRRACPTSPRQTGKTPWSAVHGWPETHQRLEQVAVCRKTALSPGLRTPLAPR